MGTNAGFFWRRWCRGPCFRYSTSMSGCCRTNGRAALCTSENAATNEAAIAICATVYSVSIVEPLWSKHRQSVRNILFVPTHRSVGCPLAIGSKLDLRGERLLAVPCWRRASQRVVRTGWYVSRYSSRRNTMSTYRKTPEAVTVGVFIQTSTCADNIHFE
jgi:hypothetical protein